MLSTKKLLTKLLRTDSGWTTVPGATGTVNYRIVRGFVWLNVAEQSPTTSWTTIATLPPNIRPARNVRSAGYCGSYGKQHMTLLIQTDGKVNISSVSAQTVGAATAIYPLI